MSGRAPAESLPRFIEPMPAEPARQPPNGEDWVKKLKWDGCRRHKIVDRSA